MRNVHLTEGVCVKLVVRILGPLRELEEREAVEVEVEPGADLIGALKKLPEKLRKRIIVDDCIAPDLLVLVDGVEISCFGSAENVRVEDVREITIIPIIHGG